MPHVQPAAGAGVNVEQVNKLLKQHRGMADMMKQMGGAKRGPMGKMAQMFGMGGGMPTPTPEQIEAMQKQLGGQLPPDMPKLPDAPPAGAFGPKPGMPGMPGLGGPKLPGLGGGGFNPFQFGKKK